MSHIVTIKAKYKNLNIIKEVCDKLDFKLTFDEKNDKHKIELADYAIIKINQNGDLEYDDMTIELLASTQFKQFQNTYCLKETERLLKKQNLKYKITENNEDEIKIEVIA